MKQASIKFIFYNSHNSIWNVLWYIFITVHNYGAQQVWSGAALGWGQGFRLSSHKIRIRTHPPDCTSGQWSRPWAPPACSWCGAPVRSGCRGQAGWRRWSPHSASPGISAGWPPHRRSPPRPGWGWRGWTVGGGGRRGWGQCWRPGGGEWWWPASGPGYKQQRLTRGEEPPGWKLAWTLSPITSRHWTGLGSGASCSPRWRMSHEWWPAPRRSPRSARSPSPSTPPAQTPWGQSSGWGNSSTGKP